MPKIQEQDDVDITDSVVRTTQRQEQDENNNGSVYRCCDKDINQLTPYEIYRAQNIERNQRRLVSLGLITDHEAKRAIDTAWGRNNSSAHDTTVNSKRCSLTAAAGSKKIQRKKKFIKECSDSINYQWEEEAWV